MRTSSPLRTIVRTASSGQHGVMHDHLDCGHRLVRRDDQPAIYRRRCFKCRLGRPTTEEEPGG